jgi:hypothetical protein
MFERNKIETVVKSGVPAEITIDTGEVLAGRMLIAMGRNLADVLNGPGAFVEFEPWGGEALFVAKASMRSVKLVQVPRPEDLKGRVAASDGFDPHGVLGIEAGASLDEIKSAWHRLSKAYHPDRYAAAELPAEVVDYLGAMARRINTAYAALEGPLQASRKASALRAAPVFTSGPRA